MSGKHAAPYAPARLAKRVAVAAVTAAGVSLPVAIVWLDPYAPPEPRPRDLASPTPIRSTTSATPSPRPSRTRTATPTPSPTATPTPSRTPSQRASRAASRPSTPTPRPTPRPTPTTPSGTPQAIARAMLADYGWTDQWWCLDKLVTHESSWRVTATNPTSGAYGLFQALPPTKYESVGSDWRTNPVTQIRWGLRYIADRYGTPCGAWEFWQAHRWY